MIFTSIVIGAHLHTAHFGQGHERMNDNNPGLYVMADNLTAGIYYNSERATSVYAGYTWATADGRFALTVGGVTGYRQARVMPLVVPSYRHGLVDGYAARVSFLPRPPKGGVGGVHLSVEREF